MDAALLARIVGSVYETVLEPGHWNDTVHGMAGLFGASAATLFRFDFQLGRPTHFYKWGHDADVERRYADHYHRLDPGAASGMAAPVGLWQADETLLFATTEAHREFINDFALPSGIGNIAGATIARDEHRCLRLSLHRLPDAPRFGDPARHLYDALKPHLLRVERIREQLAQATGGRDLARAMLDRLRCALLLCDSEGRVLLANAAAAAAMDGHHGVSVRHGRLQPASAARQAALALALKKATASGPRSASALPLTDAAAADSSCTAFVVPVPLGHELALERPLPLALVALGMPPNDSGPVELLRDLYRLTAAESALLAALLGGRSLKQVAHERDVRMSTVRAQLHSMLGKTGVGTQAGLVNLARGLPPV
jgi:DNA-binding CsgD family transcriptional regulator/PAS domain-containing protein